MIQAFRYSFGIDDKREDVSEIFQREGYTEEEADKLADDFLRSAGDMAPTLPVGRMFKWILPRKSRGLSN